MHTGHALIRHMIPHVAILGWGQAALWKGAQDMNVSPEEAILEVGASDVHMVRLFCDTLVDAIQTTHTPADLKALPIKQRITTLLMTHFQAGQLYKGAVIKTLRLLANPLNAPLSFRFLHKIIDAFWRQAGDTSTDFNYYTKRLLLGKIYVASLMYWLKDGSPDGIKTQGFIEKQLDLVLKIPVLKSKLKNFWSKRFG